jgi:hypothetical protein
VLVTRAMPMGAWNICWHSFLTQLVAEFGMPLAPHAMHDVCYDKGLYHPLFHKHTGPLDFPVWIMDVQGMERASSIRCEGYVD